MLDIWVLIPVGFLFLLLIFNTVWAMNKTSEERMKLIAYMYSDIGDWQTARELDKAYDAVSFERHLRANELHRDPVNLYPEWVRPELRELWR